MPGSRGARAVAATLACAFLLGTVVPAAAQQEVTAPQPTVPEDLHDDGRIRARGVQPGRLRHARVRDRPARDRRGMADAGGGRHRAQAGEGLHGQARALLAQDARRSHRSRSPPSRTTRRRGTSRPSTTGPRSFATRSTTSRSTCRAAARCSSSPTSTREARLAYDEVEVSETRALRRAAVFPRPRRHQGRPALALREVRRWRRAGALPILTKDEEKQLKDSWQELKKAHEATYN